MKEKILRRMLPAIVAFTLIVSIGMNPAPLQSVYAASSSQGTWIQESNGRWWYKHNDGSYTKYDWEYIDGSWYFFDSNGWMWTEWLEWEGDWYYLNPSGVMHTGWLKDDGKWYYFTSRGKMVKRWVQIDGYWYYFEPLDGHMKTDSFTYDYRTYYFYTSGSEIGRLKITKININRQQQLCSCWCWAASAVMTGTYYTNSNIGQYSVVKHIKGKTVNTGADSYEERDATSYASNYTKECQLLYTDKIKFNDLVELIDENHPFTVRMLWIDDDGNNIGGHSMVCSGYDRKSGLVYLIDPSEKNYSSYYNYEKLIDKIKIDDLTGYCGMLIAY